jgi:DNA primase
MSNVLAVRVGSQTAVEIGAVELHPGNAGWRISSAPTRSSSTSIPEAGVKWDGVVETALRMRDLMKAEGFKPWPKLTGGKGIHLMAPLEKRVPHDEAHLMARDLVSGIAARFPDRYILSAQANRRGRIFLHYLRNGRGRPRSAPIRRAPAKASRSPPPSPGPALKPESAPAAEMTRPFNLPCN